ncbi:hypothetical protein [Amycolatopsis jiangsuensis]|uniref:Uncharacterized protein n=1 Tax=Amycolatopsis jiangsuensis TaxID=1181879 RepID=A0A840IPH9_9PSEU|nr:hypothetical protein [Amycolatopsis jiangsuensis]MBB4684401.1 hypothetical protein [Amycolatopsis jiangsuensis]
MDNVVDFLSIRVGDTAVLMFGNVWAEPSAVVSRLRGVQVV